MKKLGGSVALTLGLMNVVSVPTVDAHGWVEFPNARQNICYLDGGFWENSIPNAACQAAFDVSGAYPFVQRNEVAANVANHQDMAHVQAIVMDGRLCSAGSTAKEGLDVGSAHWQRTGIKLDANNQIDLVFNATAPHNPSYWQFYLTKPTYDPLVPLTWNDLELVDTAGNVAVGEDKKYRIKVTLPADRTGDAILYTRWQREDPAGEGFYNCSDITFNGTGGTPTDPTDPTPPANNLVDLGYFVTPDFGLVETGDTIRFRTFDVNGSETTDISLAITANNTQTWPAEVAGQFNDLKKGKWFVGIWHQEMNHYMFDSKNVHANRVFAPTATPSYQLSLIKAVDPIPPTTPTNAWRTDGVYDTGDIVDHKGKKWLAQWWTTGEEPGTTGPWGVWKEQTQ